MSQTAAEQNVICAVIGDIDKLTYLLTYLLTDLLTEMGVFE